MGTGIKEELTPFISCMFSTLNKFCFPTSPKLKESLQQNIALGNDDTRHRRQETIDLDTHLASTLLYCGGGRVGGVQPRTACSVTMDWSWSCYGITITILPHYILIDNWSAVQAAAASRHLLPSDVMPPSFAPGTNHYHHPHHHHQAARTAGENINVVSCSYAMYAMYVI